MSAIKNLLETYCESQFPYSFDAQCRMFNDIVQNGIDDSHETIDSTIANFERNRELYSRCIDNRSFDEQCDLLRRLVTELGFDNLSSQLRDTLGISIECWADFYDSLCDGKFSLALIETIGGRCFTPGALTALE